MRQIELLHSVASLFDFKVINDKDGNEYVLLSKNHINHIDETIEDKTAFEAFENHEHISANIKKSDFENACYIGEMLGKAMLLSLKQTFPNKSFIVFSDVHYDEIIIRFHQKWNNEPFYYDVYTDYGNESKLFAFE